MKRGRCSKDDLWKFTEIHPETVLYVVLTNVGEKRKGYPVYSK